MKTMNNKFLFASAIALSACGTANNGALVQQSEIVITTPDERIVWIKDYDHGPQLYENWSKGIYGPAEVHLVPADKFEKMETWAVAAKR